MPCESERILLELRSWVGHNWLVILVSVFLVDFRTPKYGMIGIMILRCFWGPVVQQPTVRVSFVAAAESVLVKGFGPTAPRKGIP